MFWLLAKVLRIFFKIQIHRWLRIDPRSRQAWWQKVLWQSWGARVWEKDDQTVWYCRIHGLQRLHPRYSKIRCTFADFKRWFNFFRSSNVPPFKITRLVNFRQPISHLQNGLAQMRRPVIFEYHFPNFSWDIGLSRTASHVTTTTRIIKVRRLIRTVWDHPGRLWLIMFVWLDLLQGGFLAH